MAIGSSTIGSLATASILKPGGSANVFSASSTLNGSCAGGLNSSLASSGPMRLVLAFFFTAGLVVGSAALATFTAGADFDLASTAFASTAFASTASASTAFA